MADFTPSLDRVFILGTGLLGSSTGLALRAAGFEGEIVGWDKDPAEAKIALGTSAISRIAEDPIRAAQEAQVVLLATPVFAILDWMEQLAPVLGAAQLVTDVGSTKSAIAAAGSRLFNQAGRAAFLPGHPMSGKEVGGALHGDGALFRDAVWLFTADPVAPELIGEDISFESANLVLEWARWVGQFGCRVMHLESGRHDQLMAWVSHLPQFLATAFTAMLESEVGNAPELTQIGGRALREMTRLGASPYSMWRDVAYTNTDAIASTIAALEQRLAHLRENLRTPELRDEFDLANRFRKG